MTTKRKAISKKLRFEVFKRDSFTCQYCGRKSPNVLLEIDHIKPVSKEGKNDILNLITACKDCNAGKSNRALSDNSVLDKQRSQLEELQERKEQIDMMFRWQKGLLKLEDDVIDKLHHFWVEHFPGYLLSNNGLSEMKKLVNSFEIKEIMEAIKIAADQYLEYDNDGEPIMYSVENAWAKIGGICNNRREEKKKPYLREIRYIRAILRNRLDYINEELAIELLEKAVLAGSEFDELKRHARKVRHWTEWRVEMEEVLGLSE